MHSCITREKRRTILNKHTNTQKYTHMNEIKKTQNKWKPSGYFKLLAFEI